MAYRDAFMILPSRGLSKLAAPKTWRITSPTNERGKNYA